MKWTCIVRTAGGYVSAVFEEGQQDDHEGIWEEAKQRASEYDEGWNLVAMTEVTEFDPVTIIDGKSDSGYAI